jgi:hypothetical protein
VDNKLLFVAQPANGIKVHELHKAHPQIRADDWRSPLVRRLLQSAKYQDGNCQLTESFRQHAAAKPIEKTLSLSWVGLKEDFEKAVKTYQDAVITEHATLGLACILISKAVGLEITEVTRRREKADYWLGDRELLLEVSGQQVGNLEDLCSEKADQLRRNPFKKAGYVCVANFYKKSARLWFYSAKK